MTGAAQPAAPGSKPVAGVLGGNAARLHGFALRYLFHDPILEA
jgi:hypothetical protein